MVAARGRRPDAIGLAIPRHVASAMLDHARAELPNEAAGLLGGSFADGVAAVYHPARNAERSPLRYAVHPDDLVRIVFAIEDAGQDLVAIFHSHTRSPAIPSATDRRSAMYPDAFYVLATLADPSAPPERALRAWRIHGREAFEVPLRIRD
ncbi:MAG TPA: M67 family metallopeptidase [Candidatus Limnocylindria bacterium]|nr:M67 family metallopeptidase [Candidatus Limnocylindria bacterium]